MNNSLFRAKIIINIYIYIYFFLKKKKKSYYIFLKYCR